MVTSNREHTSLKRNWRRKTKKQKTVFSSRCFPDTPLCDLLHCFYPLQLEWPAIDQHTLKSLLFITVSSSNDWKVSFFFLWEHLERKKKKVNSRFTRWWLNSLGVDMIIRENHDSTPSKQCKKSPCRTRNNSIWKILHLPLLHHSTRHINRSQMNP